MFQHEDTRRPTKTSIAGNVPWTGTISPSVFASSPLGGEFQNLVKGSFGSGYHPYEVKALMIRRGDETKVHQGLKEDGTADDVWTIAWSVGKAEKWNPDFYGETEFFDQDEIIASVQPKATRAVMWNASIPSLFTPPSRVHDQV